MKIESKEKCWKIIENYPIKVNVENSGKNYYRIVVPEMKMRYETFDKLGRNNLSRKDFEYRKNKSSFNNDNINIKHLNDVSISSYDYHNGECVFLASTIEDVNNWLEKYKNIVAV